MHRNVKRNLSGEVWNGIYPSGCFQSFSIPKKILAVYKSIRKIEFDCEMKMHDHQKYWFYFCELMIKVFKIYITWDVLL